MKNTLFAALLAMCISTTVSFAQNERSVNISLSYGSHTFFKSTWFQQRFYDAHTFAPSLAVDVPISERFSLNAKAIVVNHHSETIWKSNEGNDCVGNSGIKEYLLLPRVQYDVFRSRGISICGRLGAVTGYVREEYTQYPSSYGYWYYGGWAQKFEFGILGVSGGIGLKNRFDNSPLSIFMNIDTYYSYRGEQSLIREYDGVIFDMGIGIDL